MLRQLFSLLLLFIFFISCEEIVNVENISNDSVQILAPTNAAVLTEASVTFNWETLGGADTYRLQVATPNFTAATKIVLDTLLSSDRFTEALDAELYEWRIKGVNSAYETAYTTNAFEVTSDLTDETITLLTPEDNATLATGAITFTWENLVGASNYQLQIATPDFTSSTSIVRDTIISAASYDETLEVNTYQWRVKGANSANETVFSEFTLLVEEP